MPEGDLLLAALDGLNDCGEGTGDSLDEDVEEVGNELEHNVLLTIGKRRTRGWCVYETTRVSQRRLFLAHKSPPPYGGGKAPLPALSAQPK